MAYRATMLAVPAILLMLLVFPTPILASDVPGTFSQRALLVMDTAPGRFLPPRTPAGNVRPGQRNPLKEPVGFKHHGACWSCHGG